MIRLIWSRRQAFESISHIVNPRTQRSSPPTARLSPPTARLSPPTARLIHEINCNYFIRQSLIAIPLVQLALKVRAAKSFMYPSTVLSSQLVHPGHSDSALSLLSISGFNTYYTSLTDLLGPLISLWRPKKPLNLFLPSHVFSTQ